MIRKVIISGIVADINRSNSAVLFLDTCAILDIIRAITRNSSGELCSAKVFFDKRDLGDIDCKIILPSVVQQEYTEHVDDARKQLDVFFKRLSDSQSELINAQTAFGMKTISRYSDAHTLISQILLLTMNIVNSSIHILEQDDLHAAASKRITKCKPPASKGKQELKDCLIVEECLEVCSQLQQKDKIIPLYFLSSNTKDFCMADTKTIRRELAAEFSQYGLEYCYSWQQILSKFPENYKQPVADFI